MWCVIRKLRAAIVLLIHVLILIPVTVLSMFSFTCVPVHDHLCTWWTIIIAMEESYVDLLRAGGIYRITISVLKHNHTLTPHPDSVTAHMPYEAVGGRLFL